MANIEHESLFPCKNRRKLFQHLRGLSFEIHQEINFEALCVWGGSECTFFRMTKFLSDLANDTEGNKYMFGAQGMVAHLPARITPTLSLSVTIFRERVVIMKSIGRNSLSTATAIGEVFRAFEVSTWAAIAAVLVFLILLSATMSYIHTGSVSASNVFDNLFGTIDDETDVTGSHNRLLRRTAVSLLGIACCLVLVIVLLFYEIGVANFIFNAKAETLSKPLSLFTDKELASFVSFFGSSLDRMLVSAVGRKFDENEYPWQHCFTSDECFKKIFDPEDPSTYLMQLMTEAKYKIKNKGACGKAAILDTWSNPEHTFPGNEGIPHGWYFSIAIPDDIAQKIDTQLLEIKFNGKLQSIMDRWVGKDGEKCAQKKLSIAVQVLMLPFVFLSGPMVVAVLVVLFQLMIIRKKK